jgi:SAM-dependent methyltransferase
MGVPERAHTFSVSLCLTACHEALCLRAMHDKNPQAAQMADESMVRTLAAQIQAIWPHEREIIARHGLPQGARALDVGSGTGQFALKLLSERPDMQLVGVDVEAAHVERARADAAALGSRAEFRVGDAFALEFADASFDLTACRHVVQAVSHAPLLLRELVRVTKPGGRVHVLAEDYGLMTFYPTELDSNEFFRRSVLAYGKSVGCDLHIGRKAPALLAEAGCVDIHMDFVVVDTLRVPRSVFGSIWRAWRDGYTDVLAERGELPRERVLAHWEDMIACIESEHGYACWLVPVASGRRASLV